MFTLIKKDLKAFSHIIFFQLAVVLLLMSFGAFYDHNGNLTVLMLIIYPIALPITLLINDTKFEPLILSFPVHRLYYALSKYLVGFIASYGIIGIGLIYSMIIHHFVEDTIYFDQLYSIYGFMFLGVPTMIAVSLTFPIYFKFSKARASAVMILFFIAMLMVIIVLFIYFEKSLTTDTYYSNKEIFPVIVERLSIYIQRIGAKIFLVRVISGLVLFFVSSLLLSLRIITRKDIGGAL